MRALSSSASSCSCMRSTVIILSGFACQSISCFAVSRFGEDLHPRPPSMRCLQQEAGWRFPTVVDLPPTPCPAARVVWPKKTSASSCVVEHQQPGARCARRQATGRRAAWCSFLRCCGLVAVGLRQCRYTLAWRMPCCGPGPTISTDAGSAGSTLYAHSIAVCVFLPSASF